MRKSLLVLAPLLILLPQFAAATPNYTWTYSMNMGMQKETGAVTYSADGTKLAAGSGYGSLYTSVDGGTTWTVEASPMSGAYWFSLAYSPDGSKLFAAVGVSVFMSTDNGVTWTDHTPAGAGQRTWTRITFLSSNGMNLAVIGASISYYDVLTDDIFTSSDGGVTWTNRTAAIGGSWNAIASSANGMKLAATMNGGNGLVADGGDIYTSTDGGVTWTDRSSAGTRYWSNIVSSADGMDLAATVGSLYTGDIYTSTDGGVTWTDRTSAGTQAWYTITSSSDGKELIAGTYNNVYASDDGGATWTDYPIAGMWDLLAASADGTKIIAVSKTGPVYVGVEPFVQPVAPTCTLSLDSNPVAYGTGGTTLRWSSSNATGFYINNVGYVIPNTSGYTNVQPSSSTDYTGTATTSSSSVNCDASSGTPTGTLNVTPPPTPTATITASSTSIYTNQPVNILATFAAGSGGQSVSSTPTVVYLTSGTSWNVPSDWNSSDNTIEVIGGGGGGGGTSGTGTNSGGGGGGGAYAKISNLSLTPRGSITYIVGSGGGVGAASSGSAAGNTYFNGTSCGAASVCAGGGSGGTSGGIGGTGGTVQVGSGSSGGSGGSSYWPFANYWFEGGGGGGAGGIHGAGNAGGSSNNCTASTTIACPGGSGDAGSGGSGGVAGVYPGSGGAGGTGAEWDASHGSGGGGGGGSQGVCSTVGAGGAGGSYGSGGGGGGDDDYGCGNTSIGGAGAPGIIVITYYPLVSGGSGTDTLTHDNIDSPVGTGLGATTNPDASKTITFSTSTPGTYTFYARATTSYYPSWTTYNQVAVNVTAGPSCTVSFSQNPISKGGSATVSWTSSGATSFSINNITGPLTPNQPGFRSVSPAQSTDYTGTASSGGVNSTCKASSGTPQGTLNVSCTQSWSCSGQTIVQTNTDCSTTNTTCVAPAYCSPGSSSCLSSPPSFTPSSGKTGHLQVIPNLVLSGKTTTLYWNISNVSSCTIKGTNSDSWSGAAAGCSGSSCSSGSVGKPSSAIKAQTTYTLSCTGLDNSPVSESQVVNVVPLFEEQ